MLSANFRPWGPVSWIMNKLPNVKWDIIGCLSSEERFIGLLNKFDIAAVNNLLIFEIQDPLSRDTNLKNQLFADNRKLLRNRVGKKAMIETHLLFEPSSIYIDSINSYCENTSGNIIFDITTFPKRFFFPILKLLLSKNLTNLIVTYTHPKKYSREDLASNPDSWAHIPMFMPVEYPPQQVDLAIVGIGFMPFGLPKLLYGKYHDIPVKFLLPFPPGPPNYQRTWEFVRKIEKSYPLKPTDDLIRVNSSNCSDAFNYISRETNMGEKRVIFAPYGPKPISLAMCLFAIKYESAVYYTQPRNYNPLYSTGIAETNAYCIKLNNTVYY